MQLFLRSILYFWSNYPQPDFNLTSIANSLFYGLHFHSPLTNRLARQQWQREEERETKVVSWVSLICIRATGKEDENRALNLWIVDEFNKAMSGHRYSYQLPILLKSPVKDKIQIGYGIYAYHKTLFPPVQARNSPTL